MEVELELARRSGNIGVYPNPDFCVADDRQYTIRCPTWENGPCPDIPELKRNKFRN